MYTSPRFIGSALHHMVTTSYKAHVFFETLHHRNFQLSDTGLCFKYYSDKISALSDLATADFTKTLLIDIFRS